MRKYLAEAIGTFALIFYGTGAIIIYQQSGGASTHAGIAVTFGLTALFWIGLILSIGFLNNFEYTKYEAANAPTECGTECIPGQCSTDSEETTESACGDTCDSTTCK